MSSWGEEDVAALLTELGEHGFGGINPDEQQLRSLLESDAGGPLQFVNLLSCQPPRRSTPRIMSWPGSG